MHRPQDNKGVKTEEKLKPDVISMKRKKIMHCTVPNPPQILLRIAEEIGDSLQRTLAWDINLNSKRMNQ